MSTISHKKSTKFNSILLFILPIIIIAFTALGVTKIKLYSNMLPLINDAPSLCTDEASIEEGNHSVCYMGEDVQSNEGYALFLYNQSNFIGSIQIEMISTVMITLGSILTIASLFAAVVYYRHNR